jgi:hypothetical protein
MTFDNYIKRIMDEDAKILKDLGSDFDEEGVPYWKKWEKMPLDKNQSDAIE